MPAGFDFLRDGCQVQRHRLDIAPGQHEAGTFALLGTDSTKDVGRRRALFERGRRSGAATGPTPGELVLLANAGFVTEPNLQVGEVEPRGSPEINALRACDRRQTAGETVLKSSTAPSTWVW